MADDFTQRIDELIAIVGGGVMDGMVVVDQIYATFQHEDLTLHHPRGGGPKYLITPMIEHAPLIFEEIAATLLIDGGRQAMIDGMESVSDALKIAAPVEFNNLRRSGHPIVTDDAEVIYDRPPEQHRLSEAEIAALKAAHPSGFVMDDGKHIFIGPEQVT